MEEKINLLKSAIELTKQKTKTSELTQVLIELSKNGKKEIQKEEYFEIDSFIKLLGEPYVSEIPVSFRVFFEKKKLQTSEFKINENEEIKEQNIKHETLALIAFLNLKYWCKDNEEKVNLSKIYEENEKKANTTIGEISDILDNIRKEQEERKKEEEQRVEEIKSKPKEELELVPCKKRTIFKIIIDKIKAIFHVGGKDSEKNGARS